MLGHRVVEVSVDVCLIEVSFGVPHLEEVSVLPTSEWIVSVFALLLSSPLGFLDVPESVLRDGGEHSGLH